MNLPEKINLTAYGETVEFTLTDKREIRYYGKTMSSNESKLRTESFDDNEVFYQTKWGWGVIVNTDTMETCKTEDGSEWGGQKIIKVDENKTHSYIDWSKEIAHKNYCGYCSDAGTTTGRDHCDGSCFVRTDRTEGWKTNIKIDHIINELEVIPNAISELEQRKFDLELELDKLQKSI